MAMAVDNVERCMWFTEFYQVVWKGVYPSYDL